MSKVLVLQKFNWADEMDIAGFEVMDAEALTDHFETVEHGKKFEGWEIEPTEFPQDVYIGSNQYVTIKDMDDYKSYFNIVPITDEENETLRNLFSGHNAHFGKMMWIE